MFRVEMICRRDAIATGRSPATSEELKAMISRWGIDESLLAVEVIGLHQYAVEVAGSSLAEMIRRKLFASFICDPVINTDFAKQRVRVAS